MLDKNDVAVVILNYITWQDSVEEAVLIHDLFNLDWKQIIIVDNASPNESESELGKKTAGDYVFIETGNNAGYASGNNAGLRYAKEHGYKLGWILNNDIIIEDKNVLDEIIRVFNSDSTIAVVNPDVYSPSGYMYNRYSKKQSFWDFTFGAFTYKRKGRRLDLKDGYGYIWRPQGCCMMVDINKFDEVNYLDEKTFLYCEELILAERLITAGYKAACACQVKIIHNHSNTVKMVLQKREIARIFTNSFRYYLKEYRHYNKLKISICVCFGCIELKFMM